MKPSTPLFTLSIAIFSYAALASSQTAPKAEKVSFGRDVRPILSEHCFKCHGPDVGTAAAGLRFDTFENATKQLGDGAAIVPGNPKASLMLDRVAEHDPEMRMPPKDAGVSALTPAQIETLRAWIAQGARYEKHWSFVPPTMPKVPAVSNPRWARNLIDRFVLNKLDEAGLKPEPEADKDTLALRAAQTLTGLPPTPAELEQFRKDSRPDAYERYVDRLMTKPEYGEHQARYWMDAVRYGDTHGLQLDNERSVYPYRDWVIQSFNDDLPFDKFVKWQIAGDLLPNPTNEQLVATGYVRMNLTTNEGGAIPEEFLARNTFDRVDTTSTVMLGLTVGCAKCHDHKFDPIKQADYYGLYAYFNSTKDDPLDGNIALPPPYTRAYSREQDQRLRTIDVRLSAFKSAVDPARAAAWFAGSRQPLPTTRDWEISPVYVSESFDKGFEEGRPGEPGAGAVAWKPFAFEIGKESAGIIGKDSAFVYVRGIVNASSARSMTLRVASDDAIKVWLNGKLIHSNKVSRGVATGFDTVKADFRAGDNELIAKVVNGAGPDGLKIQFADEIEERVDKALTQIKAKPEDRAVRAEIQDLFLMFGPDSADALAYRKLSKEKLAVMEAAPMTLIAQEMDRPRPTYILKRGEYSQPGAPVDRHIPAVLGSLGKGLPNNRLGFATWLTEPSNPLVARVFVNRIWQQHFGTGIVKTAEDFGNQGEWPLDQALLDYLAVSFVKNGWSVKKLNRLIVTSAAFRQSSRISPVKLAKDPENRLISRGPRFRLDAEVIRDKALDAGGLLVQKIGGHGVKPYQPDGIWESSSDPASGTHVYVRDHGMDIYRRSLYLFWKRTSPPPVMVTLDAPLRDTCIVRRSTTDTPLQALALLNETAFLEASRTMAVRVLKTPGTDEQRLRRVYELTLARSPQPSEVALLRTSLARYRQRYAANVAAAERLLKIGDAPQNKTIPMPEQAAWMIVCSSLMNTDEFVTQH
jgi:mono/diheme cytochrome c family protein